MTSWKTVRGDVKPLALDTTSSTFVIYERRNIREEEIKDGTTGKPYTQWVYEEREYTVDEYNNLKSPATQQIMQAISDIEVSIALMSLG